MHARKSGKQRDTRPATADRFTRAGRVVALYVAQAVADIKADPKPVIAYGGLLRQLATKAAGFPSEAVAAAVIQATLFGVTQFAVGLNAALDSAAEAK